VIAGNEILEAADIIGESREIAPELHDNVRQSRMLRRQLRKGVKRLRKTSAKSQKILAEALVYRTHRSLRRMFMQMEDANQETARHS